MVLANRHILLLSLLLAVLSSCQLVDEKTTDCVQALDVDYEMKLTTNITTQIQTQLSLVTEVAVATSLENHLKNVFTNRADDVNLSFYDVFGDSVRLYHKLDVMDATQTSYSLNIPIRRYMHLGLANLAESGTVKLENDETCHGSRLQQQLGDTIPTHRKGIFSARAPMEMKEGEDQEFNVNLYMANCAATLVLDTLGSGVRDVRVFATGFATAFDVADSVYRYQYTPVIRADKVEVKDPANPQLCYVTVNVPARTPQTKAPGDPTYWDFRVYASLSDGSVTETKLSITHPLYPGQLDVLKAVVYGNGALEPEDVSVVVNVSLNWKPGMEHEVEM